MPTHTLLEISDDTHEITTNVYVKNVLSIDIVNKSKN